MSSTDVTPRLQLARLEDAGAEERADDDGMRGPARAVEVRNPAGVASTLVPPLPRSAEGPID